LMYEITPANIQGDVIEANEDGSFSFQFPTTGFSGPMVVKVTAEDWNGNRVEASITLVDEGAIPSFTATPGNIQVTLYWDPVPLAESYTLYYTDNDALPSADYGFKVDNVSSPYTLTNLENGMNNRRTSRGRDVHYSQSSRIISNKRITS
ncbi:unnamed protein product, partial [marine sediment metagenome]